MIAPALLALARLLAQSGVGDYSTGTVYQGALPTIVMKKMPLQPDRAIVLNLVIQGNTRDIDTSTVYSDVMVQVRCRGTKNLPLDVDDVAEAVSAVIGGLHHYGFAGGEFISLARRTHIQNGQDDQGRYEVLSQFYGQITSR